MRREKGILIVLSGPSGVGKGTVRKELFSEPGTNYEYSISMTTRLPREGEVDGVDYFFKKKEEFEALIEQGKLLEYASYVGNYYGTPIDYVNETLDSGRDVFLEIEVQGAMKVKEACPEAVLVFNMPPSKEELKNRLVGRNTDAPEVIEKRLDTSIWEISQAENYDYIIVNDVVEDAAHRLLSVIEGEKCKKERNVNVLSQYK